MLVVFVGHPEVRRKVSVVFVRDANLGIFETMRTTSRSDDL